MAHIFISYSHRDKTHLDTLHTRLIENGFTPEQIWYDADINAGERWADEIEKALEDAVILVLIVTPNSLRSKYVNYEWAWAVGSGIEVIPLLFEDIGKSRSKHPALTHLQYRDCKAGIAIEVIRQITDAWELSIPALLGVEITRLISNFRVLARVVLWGYPYEVQGISYVPPHLNLVGSMREEGDTLSTKLLDYSSMRFAALTRKQRRLINKAVHTIQELSQKFNRLRTETQFVYANRDYLPLIAEIESYRKLHFEKVVANFARDRGYEELDNYLQNLSEGKKPYSSSFPMHPAMSMAIRNLDNYSTEIETWIMDIKGKVEL